MCRQMNTNVRWKCVTFEEWLQNIIKVWLLDSKKYEDRVANFCMSPKDLEEYWQNKDSSEEIKDAIEVKDKNGKKIGGVSPTMKNSPGNRTPNFSNKLKRKDKVIYWFGVVSYARDYNLLPISFIINIDAQKQFNHFIAKDRGTWNYYHTKKDTRMSISFWKTVEKEMKEDSLVEDKWRLKKIYNRLSELIKRNKPFSMKEAVPNKIYETWYNDKEYLLIRMKYEYYKSHTGEMVRYNNSTNLWVMHNTIKSERILPLIIEYPNTYKESMLDEIYDYAKEKDLFRGDLPEILNPPHNTIEEFEEIIPWIFTAFKKHDNMDVVSILARKSQANFKKLKNGYEKAFKEGVPEFISSIDFMITVSENLQINKFTIAHRDFIKSLWGKTSQRDRHPNITDLRLSGWVNFVMACHDIYNIILDIYGRKPTIEKINTVTTKYFKNAIVYLSDGDTIKDLMSKTGGTEARYELFYKKVKMKTRNELIAADEFEVDELVDFMIKRLENEGFSTKNFIIYDRVSSTQFKTFKVDFEKLNLQEGHLIPTKPLEYGNVITQLPADNKFNNNKPINDLKQYVTEYQTQLENWIDENNLKNDKDTNQIKWKTFTFLEIMIEQKDIKV